jgi:SET domain-containing protein
MIKVTVTIENKDEDAEDSTHTAKFKDFDKIPDWLEKVKAFNEEDIKPAMGFLERS